MEKSNESIRIGFCNCSGSRTRHVWPARRLRAPQAAWCVPLVTPAVSPAGSSTVRSTAWCRVPSALRQRPAIVGWTLRGRSARSAAVLVAGTVGSRVSRRSPSRLAPSRMPGAASGHDAVIAPFAQDGAAHSAGTVPGMVKYSPRGRGRPRGARPGGRQSGRHPAAGPIDDREYLANPVADLTAILAERGAVIAGLRDLVAELHTTIASRAARIAKCERRTSAASRATRRSAVMGGSCLSCF